MVMFVSMQDLERIAMQDKASRAMVLQKAREQIQEISAGNESMQREIDEIRRNNEMLLEQIQRLEANSKPK